ncbi:unnamed protein product [Sympodiomycopsis kandeliae]
MSEEFAVKTETEMDVDAPSESVDQQEYLLPPSTSSNEVTAASSSSAPTQAQRAYLAHRAPHLFDHPLSALSPSPDVSGGGGLPSSAASPSASASASSSRSPSPSTTTTPSSVRKRNALVATTKHTVPPNFRGPIPRDTDAEEVAPRPALHAVPGSQTLYQIHSTPFNRNSWRYTFAGPSTEQLPFSVYRSIPVEPSGVHWDWSDRSQFTSISKDASVVSAEKGWRSVRANLPIRQGSWYFEVEILPPEHTLSSAKDGNHVRLGFGRREAGLNAPVGFDAYSYGLRDTTCQRVFLSRPSDFYSESHALKPGDVVGMYISIPGLTPPNNRDAKDPRHVRRKRIPIRYRGQLYFEQLEYPVSKEMEHLMKRSWKGEQLLREDGTLKLLRSAAGVDVNSTAMSIQQEQEESRARRQKKKFDIAPSNPTAPPNQQYHDHPSTAGSGSKQKGVSKTKKRENDTSSKEKSEEAHLRPLPTLGSESGIAFFLNGKPLGWAFRDLLDFRPLRPHTEDLPKTKNQGGKKGGPGGGKKQKRSHDSAAPGTDEDLNAVSALGMEDLSTLTTSASNSAILKSRENNYDDGTCGYFPMISMYGGSRVRLRTQMNEFTALPNGTTVQDDMIHGLQTCLDGQISNEGTAKPLSSLSESYWNMQSEIDIIEEERFRLRHLYLVDKFGPNYGRDEEITDEEEDEQRERSGRRVKGESESASATPRQQTLPLEAEGEGKEGMGESAESPPLAIQDMDQEDARIENDLDVDPELKTDAEVEHATPIDTPPPPVE